MADDPIKVTYGDGKPLEALRALLQKRREILGESSEDAVVATAITVIKSLRADTKVAPKSARPASFEIKDTGWWGGWENLHGKYHRVVRASPARGAKKIHGVWPVNNAGQHYERGETVKVYRIEPVNDKAMRWDKAKNKKCWYVFAKSEAVARKFAKLHMTRRI